MNYRQFAHIIVIKLYAWWAHKSLIMMCKAWCLQIKGCCCMTDFVLDILLLFADLAILFGQQALSGKKKTLNITCKYDPTDRNQCMLIESMTSKSKYCNKRTPYVNLLGYLAHIHLIYYHSEVDFLIYYWYDRKYLSDNFHVLIQAAIRCHDIFTLNQKTYLYHYNFSKIKNSLSSQLPKWKG